LVAGAVVVIHMEPVEVLEVTEIVTHQKHQVEEGVLKPL
jgi:hypothetical protein